MNRQFCGVKMSSTTVNRSLTHCSPSASQIKSFLTKAIGFFLKFIEIVLFFLMFHFIPERNNVLFVLKGP
jgi:hypothetical protein